MFRCFSDLKTNIKTNPGNVAIRRSPTPIRRISDAYPTPLACENKQTEIFALTRKCKHLDLRSFGWNCQCKHFGFLEYYIGILSESIDINECWWNSKCKHWDVGELHWHPKCKHERYMRKLSSASEFTWLLLQERLLYTMLMMEDSFTPF